ncbi:alpha/beta fold hydrolase [Kineococcus sp. G2]|uniref:alpha/beta fold hydrolase n=1 Tax=Kineococcus sp. G2 TaxID=3127484 RepID=UPI00301E0A79
MSDTASFDGTRLARYAWGPEEAPVVVLVHGLGLSASSWERVVGLLAGEHRVVAYDLRGHAQSGDARSGDYSMRAQALDLDAVLRDCVPDGRGAVVVGNSLGGGVITAHAHHCGGERVAGAVFAGSGASAVTAPGLPARHLPERAEAVLRTGWLKVFKGVVVVGRTIRPVEALTDRVVRRVAFTSHAPQEAVARVRDDFLGTRPVALARTALASVGSDGQRFADELRVPALVLHGARDPEVGDEEAQRLVGALPDGELVTLRGEGHMLPLTDPRFVAEHVARWVRRVHEVRR